MRIPSIPVPTARVWWFVGLGVMSTVMTVGCVTKKDHAAPKMQLSHGYDAFDVIRLRDAAYESLIEDFRDRARAKDPKETPLNAQDAYFTLPFPSRGLSACIDWRFVFNKDPVAVGFATMLHLRDRYSDNAISQMAMRTCEGEYDDACTCAMVDINGNNVLVLPESYLRQRLGPPTSS